MKIIHLSDLHLGRFYKGELTKELSNLRREELFETFERVIDYINENNVDILLICGDIYERDYFSISNMKRFLDDLNKLKSTEVFIIFGNHDFYDKNSLINRFNLKENIHIFKSEEYFQYKDFRIYGISWDRQFNFTKNLDFNLDNNYKNILMLHGSVGSKDYFPLDKSMLSNLGFDYIALGHIHKMQKVLDNCYYSGSLEPLNFKEKGKHGFIEVEFINGNLIINEVDFSKRKYNEVFLNISNEMKFSDIKKLIIDNLKNKEKDFNKIIFEGNYKEIDNLIDYLKVDLNYFYIEYINKLKKSFNIEEIYINNNSSILKDIIDELKDDDEALEIAVKSLLEAENDY